MSTPFLKFFEKISNAKTDDFSDTRNSLCVTTEAAQKTHSEKGGRLQCFRASKAIGFIIMSAFGFAMMAAFVRLAGDLPFTQKTFFRNLVAVAVAAVVLCREKVGFKWEKGNLPAHHTRNLRHTRHFLQLLRY